MRILLINDFNFSVGGAEDMFFEEKNLLREKGHLVEIIGSNKPGSFSRLLEGWFDFKYYFLTKNIISKFRPDLVHMHGCTRLISPSPLVAAKQKNIPVIMTLHDFEIIGPKASLLTYNYRIIRKIKLIFQRMIIKNNVDYFTCPSNLLTTLAAKSFNTKNVLYLPNIVRLDPLNSNEFKTRNSKTFLYVGRLSKEKGIDVAIQAIAILVNKYKFSGIVFKIIGEGKDKLRLEKLIMQLRLTKNIIFMGKIAKQNLAHYYLESIALILPSTWRENSPLVAYEAMATKTPIIATNVGGLPDLIEPGKNGYLFGMSNQFELADYMKILYENKKTREKMGEHGYTKIKKEFNEERYYNSLISLCEKLINKT